MSRLVGIAVAVFDSSWTKVKSDARLLGDAAVGDEEAIRKGAEVTVDLGLVLDVAGLLLDEVDSVVRVDVVVGCRRRLVTIVVDIIIKK